MGILDELQKAYNSIAGIDDLLLSRRAKAYLYLKMDYVHRILSDSGRAGDFSEEIEKLRNVCKKRYLENVGRRQFIKEINEILDNIIREASKGTRWWKRAKIFTSITAVGYILSVFSMYPYSTVGMPYGIPILSILFVGALIYIWRALLKFPSRDLLATLFIIGPLAVYSDILSMVVMGAPHSLIGATSLIFIAPGLYYLLKHRYLFI